jgi:hypothetical protein
MWLGEQDSICGYEYAATIMASNIDDAHLLTRDRDYPRL